MASTIDRTKCSICNKEKITYSCHGCSKKFCLDDLNRHRQNLREELDHIQNDYDQLRQNLNDQKIDPKKYPLVEQIDQWERNSIEKIKQMAQQCPDKVIQCSNGYLLNIEQTLKDLAE